MADNTIDRKQPLTLPRTTFDMKANHPATEPKRLAAWEQHNLYGQIRASRAGWPTYILHDGPPYANGKIHLGTAFNKLVKDFIVKSKNMAGFDSPYVPGWDCHGLPIEIKADQELGSKIATLTAPDAPLPSRNYPPKNLTRQKPAFQSLVF